MMLVAASVVVLHAVPAAAQAADTTLVARMGAFLREVENEPNDELAGYFPRTQPWTWVQTVRDVHGRDPRPGVWRFTGGGETFRAITEGGPACSAFDGRVGDIGPHEGRFGMQAHLQTEGWRRVRGNRFVPPGAGADSEVFVEWRREDGAWVVAMVGDSDIRSPRVLGRVASAFTRDTTAVPAGEVYTPPADEPPIVIEGRRYVRYGLPRPFTVAGRPNFVRVGTLHRVPVYAEAESEELYEVYVPVTENQVQRYQTLYREPCR